MAYSVIFLDPRVLPYRLEQLQDRFDRPACFDNTAFEHLKGLIHRVENAAIVLIFPCEDEDTVPSLEQLKAAYQDCGLGERIIERIPAPTDFFDGHRKWVNDWLCKNQNSPNPLPIQSFVIISPKWWPEAPNNRHVNVKTLLSESDAEQARHILSSQLDRNEILEILTNNVDSLSVRSGPCDALEASLGECTVS